MENKNILKSISFAKASCSISNKSLDWNIFNIERSVLLTFHTFPHILEFTNMSLMLSVSVKVSHCNVERGWSGVQFLPLANWTICSNQLDPLSDSRLGQYNYGLWRMFIFYLQPIEQPVRTNQIPRQIPYQVSTIMDSEEYSVPQVRGLQSRWFHTSVLIHTLPLP